MAGVKGAKRGQHSGQFFTCPICGKEFYRLPSQIARGLTKTCSKACLGIYFTSGNNPFWGKTHSAETRAKLSASHTGVKTGPNKKKGRIPDAEERGKRSERMKLFWRTHREKMRANLPRGENHPFHKNPIERRYRTEWTPTQRRDWKDAQCLWCAGTDALVLDHIIPIFMGGGRYRANAQTLCQTCNTWKLWHIEVPQWHALQAAQGASFINPE